MNFAVMFTLKHNEVPDTFEDHWMPFRADEGLTLQHAQDYYDTIVETDGGKQDWHLWTICLSMVMKSTDF